MTKPVHDKPTSHEDEYFHRDDVELIRRMRARLDESRAAAPAGINCPRDGSPLEERRVGDVVMDVCPQCRGIWLDAGELEVLHHHSKAGERHEHGQRGLGRFFSDLFGQSR